jgi:hypothetical protein
MHLVITRLQCLGAGEWMDDAMDTCWGARGLGGVLAHPAVLAERGPLHDGEPVAHLDDIRQVSVVPAGPGCGLRIGVRHGLGVGLRDQGAPLALLDRCETVPQSGALQAAWNRLSGCP